MATDRLSVARRPRKNRRLLRKGLTSATLLAFGFVLLDKRSSLTRSFVRIGHPRWSWVVVGVVLEASSMMAFAFMQRQLLRVGGRRVGARPMIATILASNSVSVSVPLAGPELGAALAFRRFREQGADPTLASWTLVVGGFVSWLGAVVVLAAGGVLSGNVAIAGVSVVAGLLAGLAGLLLWFGAGRISVQRFFGRVASWVIRPLNRWRDEPVHDPAGAVTGWMESLHLLRPSKTEWCRLGAFGLGNWLSDIGVLAVSIVALGGVVPWRALLLVYALATLVGSLGLTPGGLGLVEGTLCLGLVSAGLPAALAVGAVLLYRLVSFWLVMLTGWLVLLWMRLERATHLVPIVKQAAP
jgi:putative heme transporter